MQISVTHKINLWENVPGKTYVIGNGALQSLPKSDCGLSVIINAQYTKLHCNIMQKSKGEGVFRYPRVIFHCFNLICFWLHLF